MISFGKYKVTPQIAEQPPAPYQEEKREVLGIYQVSITLLELTHLGNITVHGRSRLPGEFLPHLNEFVERTATGKRIAQAHEQLMEALKEAKARGSHLAN
jgi:hypothetical protein